MTQIKGLGTEKTIPDDSDFLAIQEVNNTTRHITRANFLTGISSGGNSDFLPTSFSHWHDESIVEAGASLKSDPNSGLVYNAEIYQNPPAINDSFSFYRVLKAGSYRISVLTVKSTNVGKLKLDIDNVLAFNDFDLYSASLQSNAIITRDVIITSDGMHKFKWSVFAKNPSSSNYYFSGRKIWGIKI